MSITFFLVEDGTVVPDATSYMTVEEADEFASLTFRADKWNALSEDDKELRLIAFTRWLDLRVEWRGTKVSPTQSLQWPRYGACNRYGFTMASTIVPREVKEAVMQAILFDLNSDASEFSSEVGLRRFRAETIEFEMQEGFMGRVAVPDGMSFTLNGLGAFIGGFGQKKIYRV